MVRAPCCEKMGMKKGPWTQEEDHILTSFIILHGHGNWRALPKLAGLLRCGKSCRLRWTNYLRPDIKRGNFTQEEEDTIIHLHELLGNRWSTIAAKLPGRTDNEIKNVWHTHLKKRLGRKNHSSPQINAHHHVESSRVSHATNYSNTTTRSSNCNLINSPQSSSSEISTTTTTSSREDDSVNVCTEIISAHDNLIELDENFWSGVWAVAGDSEAISSEEDVKIKVGELGMCVIDAGENGSEYNSRMDDGMDFWYNLFTRAEDFQVLPHF